MTEPRYTALTPGLTTVLTRLREGPLSTADAKSVCASALSLKGQVYHLRALGYVIDCRNSKGLPWTKGGGYQHPTEDCRRPGSEPGIYHLVSEPDADL